MSAPVWILILIAVVSLVVWGRVRRRRIRDSVLSERWAYLEWLRSVTPGAEVAEIATVYQRARRGTKAVIVWLANGSEQDAWFDGMWPPPGAVALLQGLTGWGPHNRNPHVFYVNTAQVLVLLPPGTGRGTHAAPAEGIAASALSGVSWLSGCPSVDFGQPTVIGLAGQRGVSAVAPCG